MNSQDRRMAGGSGSFGARFSGGDRAAKLLAAACDFLGGLNVFCEAKMRPMHSVLLLGAFGLECALKSFLSSRGVSDNDLKHVYSHDLEKLWNASANLGLPIESPPPDWLMMVHNQNAPKNPGPAGRFHIRYMNVETTSSPSATLLRDGLRSLIETIERAR